MKSYGVSWLMGVLIVTLSGAMFWNQLHDARKSMVYAEVTFAVLVGIFFLMMISTALMRYKIADEALKKTLLGFTISQLPWADIRSVIRDFALPPLYFFHIMTTDRYFRWRNRPYSTSPYLDFRWADFLRDVVLRVPPSCHVDQAVLDRIGFTQDDIGRLYKPPPEAADS